MKEKEELLNEIMEQVRKLAPEYQERVLDAVKAMVYTREVVKGEKEKGVLTGVSFGDKVHN